MRHPGGETSGGAEHGHHSLTFPSHPSLPLSLPSLVGFVGMTETLQTFPIEKRTVQKERSSGFYSLSAYYTAKVVTNVPFALAGPMLFCCILYPTAAMRAGFEHFFVFLAVIVAEVVAAGSLGMFLSSIASDPEIANAMAPAFNIIFTVFNGEYVRLTCGVGR